VPGYQCVPGAKAHGRPLPGQEVYTITTVLYCMCQGISAFLVPKPTEGLSLGNKCIVLQPFYIACARVSVCSWCQSPRKASPWARSVYYYNRSILHVPGYQCVPGVKAHGRRLSGQEVYSITTILYCMCQGISVFLVSKPTEGVSLGKKCIVLQPFYIACARVSVCSWCQSPRKASPWARSV